MSKASKWERITEEDRQSQIIPRPSRTYWQDAWRMLRKNVLAMTGLFTIIIIACCAIFLPMISDISYSDQRAGLGNIPPRIELTA